MSRITDGMAGTLAQIICGAAIALSAIPADAASFNCSRAESQVERMICGNPILSRLDDELAVVYREALSKVDDPADLRVIQRSWVNNTRDRCRDSQCVESAYRIKLLDLKSRIPAPSPVAAIASPGGSPTASTPKSSGNPSVAQTASRPASQQSKTEPGDSNILVWIAIALLGAGGAIMPKRDRRFKTGFRNFSWTRVFMASGLYAGGLAIFGFIALGR